MSDQPDFTKPFSRWNAYYWAVQYGIMAALEASEWKVLSEIYSHLPNVEPGKSLITNKGGVGLTTVKRARRRLREVGLIRYSDGLTGGANRDTTTQYTVTDIRNPDVAALIVARLTGAMVDPVHGGPGESTQKSTPDTGSNVAPVHSGPGTGAIAVPPGGHGGPGTGAMVDPKVLNISSQEVLKESTRGACAPGVPAAPSTLPASDMSVKADGVPTSTQPENKNFAKAGGVQAGTDQTLSHPPENGSYQSSVNQKVLTASKRKVSKAGGSVRTSTASELTDDHKRAIQADKSLAALGSYLLFGPSAIGLPQDQWGTLKPSQSHWAPGEATYIRPAPNATTKQLSSFAMYRINQARVTTGKDDPAILDWGRLGTAIKRLRERHTQEQVVAVLDTIGTRWAVVQAALPHWMGSMPLLDASLLQSEQVLDAARRVASGAPAQPAPRPVQNTNLSIRETASEEWMAEILSRKGITL